MRRGMGPAIQLRSLRIGDRHLAPWGMDRGSEAQRETPMVQGRHGEPLGLRTLPWSDIGS